MFISSILGSRKGLNKSKLAFVIAGLLVVSFLSSLVGDNVSASYNTMPRELLSSYNNHLSVNNNDPATGEGLKTERLLLAVYRGAAGGTTRVYFDDGACASFDFFQIPYGNDNSISNPDISTPVKISSDCHTDPSGTDGYDKYVELPGGFGESQIFRPGPPDNDPSDQKYVTILRIDLKGSGQAPRFKVTGSGERMSYIGYPYTSRPNSVNEFQYGPGLSYRGGRGEIRMYFAPPCGFDSETRSIFWRDADSNKDANASPGDPTEEVSYRIFDDTDSQYSMSSAQDAGDDSGATGRDFFFRKGHKYHITFYNVKGGAGAALPNSIQVFYPFSMAGYYNDCDFPVPGWEVDWAGNYIFRTNDSNPFGQGESVGQISDPAAPNSPQPNHNFQFINDSRNKLGGREITNLAWSQVCTRNSDSGNGKCYDPAGSSNDRWLSDSYQVVNPSYTNQEDYENYQDNTQVIHYDRAVTVNGVVTSNANFSDRGTGVGSGAYIGGPGWVWDTFSVTAADGGTSKCVDASFWPKRGTANKTPGIGTTSWTIPGPESRDQAPTLCINVPHYYSMTSVMTTHPVTMTQQGDGVTVRGEVTNPLTDAGGRYNTNSHDGLAKGIVEFQVPAGVPEPVVDAEASNPLAPCAWVSSKVAGSSACDDTKGRQTTPVLAGGGPMVLSYTRPPLDTISLSVGTKLCYAIYVQHPKHVDSVDASNINGPYSYTSIDCTVVVKSPKVQFENGDLTVGRHWIDGQTHSNLTACEDMVGTASITASGAPDVVRDDTTGTFVPKERYGSWVEYGAFARGAISGMGTGSRPFGLGADTVDGAKRLMFSNTVTGGFDYGVTCLNNPFETIRTDDPTKITNFASLPALPAKPSVFDGDGNLRINELAELYDNSYDKTGYVSKGKDIKVTPRPKDAYSVRVKLKAAGQSGNEVPNGPLSPPKVRVSVGNDSGVYEDKEIVVNSAYPTTADYEATFNLGDAGYKGPQDVSGSNPTVDIDFVNNNHNDAWDADSSKMTDRNLYLGDITVEWLKNGAVIDSSGPHAPASLAKDGHDYYTGNAGAPCPTQTANASGLFPILSSTGDNGYQLGYCHGVHLYQSQLGFNPEPAPPSLLSEDYPNFGGDGTRNGRDIVLYAQRDDPSKDCSDPANDGSGNLFIDQDIVYKRSGYSKLTELPRLVFVADCDITIANDVSNIYASLIAGDAVKTCSTKAKTVSDCEKNLRIVGAVSANRLLLWRTYGADLTSAGAAQTPAESFSMSPSQMITGYTRGNDTPKPKTAHQKDLPPRY